MVDGGDGRGQHGGAWERPPYAPPGFNPCETHFDTIGGLFGGGLFGGGAGKFIPDRAPFSVGDYPQVSTHRLEIRIGDTSGAPSSTFIVKVNGQEQRCSTLIANACSVTFDNAYKFGAEGYDIGITQISVPARYGRGHDDVLTGGFIAIVYEEYRTSW